MATPLEVDIPEEPFSDDSGEQPYQPEDIEIDRGVITTPYDAPVRTLLDEIKEKVLIVNPPFQRQGVWKEDRQSKLIESLLLNIPIPVLYFAEDEDGTRVVVDGQQRLRAIDEYYSGQYRLQKLEVLAALNGKRWTDLSSKQSRTILSRTMRCVVISSTSPSTLRFEMFERLNTGGIPLNDQELRNCVFRGPLNDLINSLVHSQEWLSLVGRSAPDNRMRHHELALRFFSLRNALPNYRPPLKRVLNDYLRKHRLITQDHATSLRKDFMATLAAVGAVFGRNPFRRVTATGPGGDRWDTNLNRAVYDVQMLGFVGQPLELVAQHKDGLLRRFRELCLNNSDFAVALSLATADRRSLYTRLRLWGQALASEGIKPEYLGQLPNV